MKIWDWIKTKVLRRDASSIALKVEPVKPLRIEPPRKPQKAIHQDISKFMKHGRQAPWYRASVKAKKKPEED